MAKLKVKVCPRCGRLYDDYPALSRRCDRQICPECGREEAFEDFGLIENEKPLSEWEMPPMDDAKCPRCGSQLYPSDVGGYRYVCHECDENFYGIEVK